ncbi:MAG: carbon storage regulator [Myxococcota bacterium]
MLSLARRQGERIRIGEDIVLVVREIRGKHVKLGIEAPSHIRVLREEIYQELRDANQAAARHEGLPKALTRLDKAKP